MSDQELAPSANAATFLRIALDSLGAKALRWAVLLMSGGMFAYTLMRPHWINLVASTVFTFAFVFPSWWRKNV
jgi:hypothetical protein